MKHQAPDSKQAKDIVQLFLDSEFSFTGSRISVHACQNEVVFDIPHSQRKQAVEQSAREIISIYEMMLEVK